jgi:nitroimidazol reductase NimA-like FMN-containing flavoprotein (pyridoxamine 5'-phosphate oxidase superfamily)
MDLTVTPRTRVRRVPKRGVYDRATVEAILDEGLVCHLAFVHLGQPFCIPTIHARVGRRVYLHGSAASRMVRTLGSGAPACLTVTHVDGIVLARSVFHHSMNYRSAMVLGTLRAVEDPDEKLGALEALTERLVPGRWPEVRWPSRKELKATSVLALELDEASAKVRTGPPGDDEEDLALPVWAGVIPVDVRAGAPEPDGFVAEGTAVPDHVATWTPQRPHADPKGAGDARAA